MTAADRRCAWLRTNPRNNSEHSLPYVIPAATPPLALPSVAVFLLFPPPPLQPETADDVHGCYQDVIAQILQEQQRARASRSELLNAQANHLTQIGDQWPAFQQLQVIFLFGTSV